MCTDFFEVTEMAASSFVEKTRTSEKKQIESVLIHKAPQHSYSKSLDF